MREVRWGRRWRRKKVRPVKRLPVGGVVGLGCVMMTWALAMAVWLGGGGVEAASNAGLKYWWPALARLLCSRSQRYWREQTLDDVCQASKKVRLAPLLSRWSGGQGEWKFEKRRV